MAATKGQSKGREADEGNGPERHENLDNKTQKSHGYAEPNYPYKYVPELGWPVK
jgi:hypothetical protein